MDRMNRRALSMIAVSCLVGSLWTLPALAQSSTTVERVGGAADEIEKVSNEEKPEKSRRAIDKMRGALTKVIKYLEEAREQRDVLKLNCVNEALSAIKGLMRLSEQHFMSLQEAVAKNNARTAEHEYVKLDIAHKKIGELDGRLRSCGGPASSGRIDGRPEIVRIKDPDLPEEDPVENLNEFRVDIGRPPSASPFF